MARFDGLRPWSVGSEIIEVDTGPERVDLHNDCVLTAIELDAAALLPGLSLNFRHDSGRRFRLTFTPVLDLAILQDPDDWITYLSGEQNEQATPEYANFFALDVWDGPGELSRFTVRCMLGQLQFKSPQVRWVEDPAP